MRARDWAKSRHNVRKSHSFAWRGAAWRGVGNILCIHQIKIEMENIRGITTTITTNDQTYFLSICMFFFVLWVSPKFLHFVIISFENMTYLHVYKHEFGKGRFLSWNITHIYISILNRWYEIFWPYNKSTQNKIKPHSHTHQCSEIKKKKWWMCCNKTRNDRNVNVEQNTRKLVCGSFFLFCSFIWGVINCICYTQNWKYECIYYSQK